MNLDQFQQAFLHLRQRIGQVVLGQDEVVEQVLIALFARGHVLLDGVPGLGKTLLVRTLGRLVGCDHKRIQFTPDLMPNDITGGNVFNQKHGEFDFVAGPIFTQLLLADEINRAPAKTQSALLEAMQDRSMTADGVTRPLPDPFFVLATQNPVEFQGTYPLPEAQLDRFLMKIEIDHPSAAVEQAVLKSYVNGFDAADLQSIDPVLSVAHLTEMQQLTTTVAVDDSILGYITDLVRRTRDHRALHLGASPRGSIALLTSARVRAAATGRNFVSPDDVKSLAPAVLRHRVVLHPDAEIEGVGANEAIEAICKECPVPGSVGPPPAGPGTS